MLMRSLFLTALVIACVASSARAEGDLAPTFEEYTVAVNDVPIPELVVIPYSFAERNFEELNTCVARGSNMGSHFALCATKRGETGIVDFTSGMTYIGPDEVASIESTKGSDLVVVQTTRGTTRWYTFDSSRYELNSAEE